MADVSLKEAKEVEKELDGYFVHLAQEEFLHNKPFGPGEKGCKLLRALRSMISENERLEKAVESHKDTINGK